MDVENCSKDDAEGSAGENSLITLDNTTEGSAGDTALMTLDSMVVRGKMVIT